MNNETYLDLSAIDKLNLNYNSQTINFEVFTQLTTLKIPYYSLYIEKLIKLTNLTELHITPHNSTNFESLNWRETRGIYGLTKLTNLSKLTIEDNNYFKDSSIFSTKLNIIIHKSPSIYKSSNSELENL